MPPKAKPATSDEIVNATTPAPATSPQLLRVHDPESPDASQILRTAALVHVTKDNAAIAPVTLGQKQLASYLNELEVWLSLPFVSPRAVAQLKALFRIDRHGETQFERPLDVDKETGEVPVDDVHLWLCKAQDAIEYQKNGGDVVHVPAGEFFILSQRKNHIRDRVAEKVTQLLESEGPLPNVTCRFAPLSAMAKAKGWSAAVAFAVVDPSEVIEQDAAS